MNLFYELDHASVYNIHEVNSSFASGSLKVLYLGNNRNGSHFTKQAVERALPSLKNVPIVCHWDRDAGEIGGHDVELSHSDNGSIRFINLTEPCGVVPDHAKFSFVTDVDDEGLEHDYLVIDGVLLWKRQDVYTHIVNDLGGNVKHSMEINVKDGAINSDGYYDVRDFEFTALCLLENCEPCFQGSKLEVYATSDFKAQMNQMMSDLREYFTVVNTSNEVDYTNESRNLTEGGERVLENIAETIEATEAPSVEFCEANLDAENTVPAVMPVAESDSEQMCVDVAAGEDFALTNNVVDELNRAVSKETVEMPWGTTCRYWYIDCDMEANEVYCYDTNDWLIYGFSYSVSGDAVEVDFESKKRMKFVLVPFDNGEQGSPIVGVFESINDYIGAIEDTGDKLSAASEQIAKMEVELETLRQFKESVDAERMATAREEIFAQFVDLDGNDEYEALKENAASYSVEDLKEKCFAIRGRNLSVNFNLNSRADKLFVAEVKVDSEPSDPYGGIINKYKNKK